MLCCVVLCCDVFVWSGVSYVVMWCGVFVSVYVRTHICAGVFAIRVRVL